MKTKAMLAALAALAQQTRLAIFRYLVEIGPDGAAVGSIGAALKVAPATLSFHLKELSHADLVVARQDGRFVWYAANFATMNSVIAYLTENCCAGKSCDPVCAPAKTRSTPRRIRS
ncbi:MAG: ArsR/SmtB family transcription factor [Rudaea sp.]